MKAWELVLPGVDLKVAETNFRRMRHTVPPNLIIAINAQPPRTVEWARCVGQLEAVDCDLQVAGVGMPSGEACNLPATALNPIHPLVRADRTNSKWRHFQRTSQVDGTGEDASTRPTADACDLH